jgi:hypothetical protein
MTRAACAALVGVLPIVGASAIAQELSRADAASMERKITAISQRSAETGPRETRLETSFTDREVNAYLHFMGKEQLPVGVVTPRLTIGDAGKVEGKAIVDLDAVRTSKPRGPFDPANFLAGSVEVWVSGRVLASNGQGIFQFDAATLAGVPISKSLLQQVVGFYTRTPDNPAGFDLDKPFTLPASIVAVRTRAGGATVVQ